MYPGTKRFWGDVNKRNFGCITPIISTINDLISSFYHLRRQMAGLNWPYSTKQCASPTICEQLPRGDKNNLSTTASFPLLTLQCPARIYHFPSPLEIITSRALQLFSNYFSSFDFSLTDINSQTLSLEAQANRD